MADVRRSELLDEPCEEAFDLVRTLLGAESNGDAVFAYSLLRESLSDEQLVALANLRELIRTLPEPPFTLPIDLTALTVARYESSGHSMRRIFESDHGLFALEFVGGGPLCRAINVYTATSRFDFTDALEGRLDETMLEVLSNHGVVFDTLTEALALLGVARMERPYESAGDFPLTHASAAADEAFGALF